MRMRWDKIPPRVLGIGTGLGFHFPLDTFVGLVEAPPVLTPPCLNRRGGRFAAVERGALVLPGDLHRIDSLTLALITHEARLRETNGDVRVFYMFFFGVDEVCFHVGMQFVNLEGC
jgi:hypothetical protein